MRLLSRFLLWQKLLLVVVALILPAAILGVIWAHEEDAQVAQAQQELQGARYIQQLGSLAAELHRHGDQQLVELSGNRAAHAEVQASQDAIQARLTALVRSAGAGLSALHSAAQWQSIQSEWQQLQSQTAQRDAAAIVAHHQALLERIRQLSDQVARRSGLQSEATPQTAMLVQIAVRDVPGSIAAAAETRWYAIRGSLRGSVGADDRIGLKLQQQAFDDAFAEVSRALELTSAQAAAVLAPKAEAVRATSASFAQLLESKLLQVPRPLLSPADILSSSLPLTTALQSLCNTAYVSTDTALQSRLREVEHRRALTISVALCSLALALMLAWLISRSLSQPLQQAIGVFEQIARGRYDSQIQVHGSDEPAQVLSALREMQGRLGAQLDAERTSATANRRIRQALDKVATSVILADAGHRIIYLNDAARATFLRAQAEIRRSLPAFDAAQLEGLQLEALSSDPARYRHFLEGLTGSHTHDLKWGRCCFRTISSAVRDGAGERIGTVVEWLDLTAERAIESEIHSMVAAVAAGDLAGRIEPSGKSGFHAAMAQGFNQLADNLSEIVTSVKAVTAQVRSAAQEITEGNVNLSQRTENQSASLQQTASSMEEMTSTVRQNADNAGQANQLAVAARDQAEQGGRVVDQAVAAMNDIAGASSRIADIIGVIDEIAFQTNLLALNAAVEAARAGEQGRGFAVVASEVRNLAGRSASAAREIKALIEDSVRKVQDGATLVTQSGQALAQIVLSVKKVSDIVAEIAAASREQSAGIEQVNRAVVQMDELTQQDAALVEEATAASQQLAAQVQDLQQLLDRYRSEAAEHATMRAVPRAAVTPAAAKRATATPARTERRKADRPWSQPRATAGLRTAAAAATAATGAAVETAPEDSEWQEF